MLAYGFGSGFVHVEVASCEGGCETDHVNADEDDWNRPVLLRKLHARVRAVSVLKVSVHIFQDGEAVRQLLDHFACKSVRSLREVSATRDNMPLAHVDFSVTREC